MYAVDENDKRVEVQPKMIALCPLCKKEVIAKCGDINIWHFAHKNLEDCDTWSEGETEWHLNWKKRVIPQRREVVLGKHRADIVTKGMVLELQNSPISSQEIIERENYYKNMVWVFNVQDVAKNMRFGFGNKNSGGYYSSTKCTISWKWFRKSLTYVTKPLYLDMGKGMIEIKNPNKWEGKRKYCNFLTYAYFCKMFGLKSKKIESIVPYQHQIITTEFGSHKVCRFLTKSEMVENFDKLYRKFGHSRGEPQMFFEQAETFDIRDYE